MDVTRHLRVEERTAECLERRSEHRLGTQGCAWLGWGGKLGEREAGWRAGGGGSVTCVP